DGKTFIHMSSSIQGDVLTITSDNSYQASIAKKNGIYLSSKREGEGIGISSVMAAATKYNGGTRFEEDDGIFKASVYLKMATNQSKAHK
ncbi:MAG: GHKL domain-containing protein, partial [Tissierellaceae bacterium]